jgi:hypothetical protein
MYSLCDNPSYVEIGDEGALPQVWVVALDSSYYPADEGEGSGKRLREVDMNASDAETALARLQARRQQIQQELSQLARQIAQTRLRVVTVEQRIARLTRSQRPAA